MGFSVHRGSKDSESLYSAAPGARVTVYVGDAASSLDLRFPSPHVTVVIDEGAEAGAETPAEEVDSDAGESSPTPVSEEKDAES